MQDRRPPNMDDKNFDRLLLIGLKRWQQLQLFELEEDLAEHRSDFLAAQNGLAIVRENPGEVKQDVIEILWANLGESAEQLARLESEHQEVMQMDVPTLLIAFQRKDKPRWALLH